MKCPKCQTKNPENAKFCIECGAPLNIEEKPPRHSAISEAARKRVTALFSDLSGNGIEAKGCLEKAGVLFQEMGLEKDLEDLDRLKAVHGL
jgi:hypothetical protein